MNQFKTDTALPRKIWLIAGRTGGPVAPLTAIAKSLKDFQPVIIGISGGFEERVSLQHSWPLRRVVEAKVRFVPLRKKWDDVVLLCWEYVLVSIKMIIAIIQCFVYYLRDRPIAIITAGSFLNIPVYIATRLSRSKLVWITHQQDVEVGKANQFVARGSDILTASWKKTLENKSFQSASLIPNPIDIELYSEKHIASIWKELNNTNNPIVQFLHRYEEEPLLLVYGGGSGSERINNFVFSHIDELTKEFTVFHITGHFRDVTPPEHEKYFSTEVLIDSMPLLLSRADVVLSRAGMGSITELLYLKKQIFLVPIYRSHQESNAEAVKEYATILNQQDPDSVWLGNLRHWKDISKKYLTYDLDTLHKYFDRIHKHILQKR